MLKLDSGGSSGSIETCGAAHLPVETILNSRHELREGETVLCNSEGKNCKHVQCYATRTNADSAG